MNKKQLNMERIGVVSIEEVLAKIGPDKINFLDYPVKMDSVRYKIFRLKGCNCVTCGIGGKYFALERHPNANNPYHLNLYAIDNNGDEILMTVDHIVPSSKGGKRTLVNLQPMCTLCNIKKGSQ